MTWLLGWLTVQSHVELNQYFADKKTWKKRDIEIRSDYLAKRILNCWPYFGDIQSPVAVSLDNITGSKPVSVTILGQPFSISLWRDVYIQTLETIAELEPDRFDQLISEFPRFIGHDAQKFRRFHQLRNGCFVETHLNAKTVYQFCIQAMEAIGLSMDDWKVETEGSTHP